jgi:uncharacterized protein (DUF736 family)
VRLSTEEKENIMIIGKFSYDAASDSYTGDIITLTFTRAGVQLKPHEKSGEDEPNYRVVAKSVLGTVEFGAAWKRSSEKNGQEDLSVAIDDPAFPGPLNAALFLDEDGETASLVWKRKKAEAKAPVAKKAPKPKKATYTNPHND